jgi:uncharacterized membrane protein YhdT
MNPVQKYLLPGLVACAALTALIGLTAQNLSGFEIVGKTVPFAYPWRLAEPNAVARLTAWGFYLAHNLIAWAIIYLARRSRPGYSSDLRWFNWALIATNLLFVGVHILQTQLWYDGLAADVPELSALGSVALVLIVILILENPRRGLLLGEKIRFHQRFVRVAREYHGYFFSWAIIYTFWYHPTEGTAGHIAGFFYMFMLFVQSALLFNRAHLNRWWTLSLEAFVLIHGVTVAVLQGNTMWPMFAFGFGAIFVLVQMYGLGLNTWTRRIFWVLFIVLAVGTYAYLGRLSEIHEILRIPVLDYLVIGLLYLIFLAGLGISKLYRSARAAVSQQAAG